MPTYEYLCRKCGKEFIIVMSLKELETTKITCRHCGSDDVSRQLSHFISKTSRKS